MEGRGRRGDRATVGFEGPPSRLETRSSRGQRRSRESHRCWLSRRAPLEGRIGKLGSIECKYASVRHVVEMLNELKLLVSTIVREWRVELNWFSCLFN